VWLGVGVAAVVGALSMVQYNGVSTAFFAMTGIAVIGLNISYAIPLFLRLRHRSFIPGPWNLRGHGKIVGWIALSWIVIGSLLFMAPLFPQWQWWNPDDVNTANFAGPLIVVFSLLVGGWWLLSARKWFTGPRTQGTEEELLAIERDLDASGPAALTGSAT